MTKGSKSRAAPVARTDERYILVPELMQRTGIQSRMTVDDWCRRGLLPPKRRIGVRRVGWLESELIEVMRNAAPAAIAPAPVKRRTATA